MKTSSDVTISDVFTRFRDPMAGLNELINVERVDDNWFDQNRDNDKCLEFADQLQKKVAGLRNRRSKGSESAIHDSLLLMWVSEQTTVNGNTFLLTTDTALVGKFEASWIVDSPAILLGSLLQWLSPVVSDENSSDFSSVFADMIRKRLLPQEQFFKLKDFLIFHDMEMNCKNLPAKDVEGAVLQIRKVSADLNLSKLEDKIKLFHIVAGYFASPDREYKHEIERLEQSIEKMTQEFQAASAASERTAQVKETEIKDIKREFREFKDDSITLQLRREGKFRIGITAGIFIILVSLIIYGGVTHGAGGSLWQKILNTWPIILTTAAFCIGLSWFIVGEQRFRALGWSIRKLFKYSE